LSFFLQIYESEFTLPDIYESEFTLPDIYESEFIYPEIKYGISMENYTEIMEL
jgi:hypothetical protein